MFEKSYLQPQAARKGHGNEPVLPMFFHKTVRHDPLQYHLSRFDFDFEFEEIFVSEKRLPVWMIHRVAGSPHGWYGESPIEFFKRKLSLSVMVIRIVVDSQHQWYGELSTPHILESGNRWLCVSLIWRVDNSLYRWVRESTPVLVSPGVAIW